MTIEERIERNPNYQYTKLDKQWRGFDVYEVTRREDPRPPGYKGPVCDASHYVLVDKDGNSRALDVDECWDVDAELFPENLGLEPKDEQEAA